MRALVHTAKAMINIIMAPKDDEGREMKRDCTSKTAILVDIWFKWLLRDLSGAAVACHEGAEQRDGRAAYLVAAWGTRLVFWPCFWLAGKCVCVGTVALYASLSRVCVCS